VGAASYRAPRQSADNRTHSGERRTGTVAFVADKGRNTPQASTITVNSLADVANASDGQCTLREAITSANSDSASGSVAGECGAGSGTDTIDLNSLTGTISLDTSLPEINSNMNFSGPGPAQLTIQRSLAGGTPEFTVLSVNSQKIVTITGLTISNGSTGQFGGNLWSKGTTTVTNCVLKNAAAGGAIFNFSGTLTINNSTITGNNGGGLINQPFNSVESVPAAVTINNSTVSNNNGTAIDNNVSNASNSSPGTVVVNNSTISGNTLSAGFGSTVNNSTSGTGIAIFTAMNTTISGNSAASGAGGISNRTSFGSSSATKAATVLTNSTVYGNSNTGGSAGGILVSDATCGGCDVSVKLRNTIVAGNTSGGSASDIMGFPPVDSSSSNNLIGTGGSGGLVNGVNGNQVGVASPGLKPLANYGGPNMTHALLSSSPALDAGDNCVTQATHCGDASIPQITQDQRGFNRNVDGPDGDTIATVDIGAYEMQSPLAFLGDTSTNEDTQLVIVFDLGDPATVVSITASSSNATVVPNDTAHLSATTDGSNGLVTINPAADANGMTDITITVNRTGGPESKTFTLTVNPVNDAPSFTRGPDQVVNEDAGAQTITGWATAITTGPPDESASGLPQTWTFQIIGNTNPALFSAAPAISVGGNLTYTPAPDGNGTATITVNLKDNGGTANGGVDTSPSQTLTITVNAVNDAPLFVKGIDQTVNEDAGAQSVPNWATAISAGAANEAGQTLTFQVTNNTNSALFSAGPAISSVGTLTYTPAANANGSATITINLKDNGGTANGGVDTSAAQSFTITVNAVNDAPVFTKGTNQTVNEDAGAQTVNSWATAISAGPANESGQTLTFQITGNTNAGLFSAGPAISSTGTLTYTPAANANGTATITVNLQDDGGTANGGADTSAAQTFTITVNAVNDAPSFTKGADQTTINAAGAQTVTNWATNISAGPNNESAQTVTFQVTGNTNSGLFSAGPAVSPMGTLTYTPTSSAGGTATFTIVARDNGGTANGGIDTSAPQTFTITVTPAAGFVNFASSTGNTTENSGSITVNVVRTGNTATPITVIYATNADTGVPCSTANGVASPKCDFTAALGTLNFGIGETSKPITILISQDSFVEGPEAIMLTLSSPTGNSALGTPSSMTVTIADDATEPPTNIIDDPNMFVRMHYHDFLNREADQAGLDFWTGQMTNCGNSDLTVCRVNVSAAFFVSIEFQQTGYLVERMYKTAYGDATGTSQIGGSHQIFVPVVRANEFLADTQRVGRGVVVNTPGWETALENNKQAYALEFVQTSRFINALPTSMTPAQFVDKLNTNAGGVLSVSERQAVINLFGNSVNTTDVNKRAQALRQVAEDPDLQSAEFNRAFVLSQYIGYLRRNPNDAPESSLDYTGYDFWLGKLVQFNGDYIKAEMVKAFISSPEYRQRFGQ
jgi:CSLREA domain-containing protein